MFPEVFLLFHTEVEILTEFIFKYLGYDGGISWGTMMGTRWAARVGGGGHYGGLHMTWGYDKRTHQSHIRGG